MLNGLILIMFLPERAKSTNLLRFALLVILFVLCVRSKNLVLNPDGRIFLFPAKITSPTVTTENKAL